MNITCDDKPVLPPGVIYRHNLWFLIWALFVFEIMPLQLVFENWRNGSIWFLASVALSLSLFVAWLAYLWRMEKRGWWIRSPLVVPTLPARFSGLGWDAVFDNEGISLRSHFGQKTCELRYSQIHRVDASIKGRGGGHDIFIGETGTVPLVLNQVSSDKVTLIVALLNIYAPQSRFCGILAPMREGWRPRSSFE